MTIASQRSKPKETRHGLRSTKHKFFSSFVLFMVKRMGLDDMCDFDYGLDADEAVGKQRESETSKREDEEKGQ